ncbi:MAG: glycosyltransferase family 4 protein, partial [Desulfomonilaceae bacterium]
MKILILSNVFPPGFIGGYELGALDIGLGLKRLGHEIQVLTSDYFLDDSETIQELTISRTLRCSLLSHDFVPAEIFEWHGLFYDVHNIRMLSSAIRKFLPDLVLLFNIAGLGAVSIVQFLDKIRMPTVLYLMDNVFSGLDKRSELFNRYTKIIGGTQLGASIKVIAMSKTLSNEVSETLGIDLGTLAFVPGWVDLDVIGKTKIVPKVDGCTRFVFCSQVAPHKGTDLIVEATSQLVKNGFCHFFIDMFGPGQVGPFLNKVKARNLDDYIKYQGIVRKANMLSIFSRYDALLFPTWVREPFGFVVSEAAASGCFPIITNGCGASEWFFN